MLLLVIFGRKDLYIFKSWKPGARRRAICACWNKVSLAPCSYSAVSTIFHLFFTCPVAENLLHPFFFSQSSCLLFLFPLFSPYHSHAPTVVPHHPPSFTHLLDLDLACLLLTAITSLLLSATFASWLFLSALVHLITSSGFHSFGQLGLENHACLWFWPPSYPLPWLSVPLGMSHFTFCYCQWP